MPLTHAATCISRVRLERLAVAGQRPKTDGDWGCARRVLVAAIAVATARLPRMTLVA